MKNSRDLGSTRLVSRSQADRILVKEDCSRQVDLRGFLASRLPFLVVTAILVLGPILFPITSFTAQKNRKKPQRQKPAEPVLQTLDELFLEVARTNPGFGGMFLDEKKQILYVYSKTPESESLTSLRQGLESIMGPDLVPQARIEVLPAKYSFVELKNWQEGMTAHILAIPGVVLVDSDETKNRVTIGVESLLIRCAIEDVLKKLGIPLAAVNLEVTKPFKTDSSLTDKHRPIVAGLQITSVASNCTLGFLAIREGLVGFVTNSHCTSMQGALDGTVFHQATALASFNRIGSETVDPAYVAGGDCPVNRQCRRSDAAFVQINTGVNASLSRIARPALNSTAWNGVDKFVIVAEGTAVVGQTVTKVGRTTGRTQGKVTKTCINTNTNSTNFSHYCQTQADYRVAGGDSGSPVFWIKNPPDGAEVVLLGIHFMSNTTTATFSPIGNITGEIGRIECISRKLCKNNQKCCDWDACGGCTSCVPLNFSCN